MRTLVDIPDADVERLDALAQAAKRSRAAEIRAAIVRHLDNSSNQDWLQAGYGYWKDRDDIGDGVDYQRAIREDRTIDY